MSAPMLPPARRSGCRRPTDWPQSSVILRAISAAKRVGDAAGGEAATPGEWVCRDNSLPQLGPMPDSVPATTTRSAALPARSSLQRACACSVSSSVSMLSHCLREQRDEVVARDRSWIGCGGMVLERAIHLMRGIHIVGDAHGAQRRWQADIRRKTQHGGKDDGIEGAVMPRWPCTRAPMRSGRRRTRRASRDRDGDGRVSPSAPSACCRS